MVNSFFDLAIEDEGRLRNFNETLNIREHFSDQGFMLWPASGKYRMKVRSRT